MKAKSSSKRKVERYGNVSFVGCRTPIGVFVNNTLIGLIRRAGLTGFWLILGPSDVREFKTDCTGKQITGSHSHTYFPSIADAKHRAINLMMCEHYKSKEENENDIAKQR